MAKHSSNVYTVLLLAAFLALAGVSALLWAKLTDEKAGYGLKPAQIFGFEELPSPVPAKGGGAPAN